MTEQGTHLEVRLGIRSWILAPGESARIGRGVEAEINVAEPSVSRVHAFVHYDDGWWIQDEGSASGLWIGGKRESRSRIEDPTAAHLGHPDTGAPIVSLALRAAQRIPAASTAAGNPEIQAGSVRLGRGIGNDISIPDVLASRNHATLRPSGNQIIVEDLGSLNGTYLNGRRVSGEATAQQGDRLTIGNSDYRLRIGEAGPLLEQVPDGEGLRLDSVGFEIREGRKPKALLKDVEFASAHGRLLAVIGPSGAGKSTLMSVMTGANRPTSGSIRFDDQDINKNYEALRTRIGFVPQEDILHRTLTVRQALQFAARLRLPADTTPAERHAQIRSVLAQLGLTEHADTRVSRLSGGQRKRASVALELLTEPSLLILDEPTSGLDPAMDKQVMDTLRQLANAGRVVVVVTHNVANLGVCDQVILLAKGGVLAYAGRPDTVLSHFRAADWADVFRQASEEAEQLYRLHRQLNPTGQRRIPQESVAGDAPPDSSSVALPAASRTRQMRAIVARQLFLLWADKGYFIFLALLPVVLGGLALVVPGSKGFGTPNLKEIGEPSQLLVVLIFGSAFMGMALSARDLVGERAIFRRENAVGLRPGPYLLAKSIVCTGVCLVQSAVMTGIVLIGKPAPENYLLTDVPGLEVFFAIALTAVVCSFLGLAMSAWVQTSEQVMPLLVVTAMAMLVLAGGLIPVTGRTGLEQVSWLSPTRWGFALGAQSIDLKALVPSTEDDWLWTHSLKRAGLATAALAGLGALSWALAWFRLAKLPRNSG
ncbi:ATP-binding cassette domain-containing protein [Paenarthrobacter nitroguajacolicus]|uniref:ATP-binding cassette domain-containing protein n=1 Tax=Paenarthrobacter nitroguajacolicus TaxID=211146 RepID=UPI0040546871